MKLKRIVIIGAGAVGGSIGGLLTHAGKPVVLVARGEHARQMRSAGLTVRMPDQSITVKPLVVESLDQLDWMDGDVAMFATKLQDALPLMDALNHHVGRHVPVVCASNGVHGERWACDRFDTVVSMLVWMPATDMKPGEVRLYAAKECRGVLDNGPAAEPECETTLDLSKQLCDWLQDAGFAAVVRADIHRWKHAKWITNLGNAAQALVKDDWRTIATMAKTEGELVLSAANLERVPTQELLDRCRIARQEPIDGRQREGGSSWQSFQRGQNMETRWIEGAMAELAAEFGVSAPVNTFFNTLSLEPRQVSASDVLDAIH